jgi:hypothetical protein
VGPCVSTRAHVIRAWATSLAAKHALSMSISHYLRDVAKSREDGTFGMPAVVAAGVITMSSR